MNEHDFLKLQNGSDIRGIALEGVDGEHVNLTTEVCRNIGAFSRSQRAAHCASGQFSQCILFYLIIPRSFSSFTFKLLA